MTQPGMYAVAVRDEKLYLFLRIKRNPKGEVFVIFPREDNDWDPHSSVHKNGTHHQKSFNHKFAVQTRQKPSAQFQGTSNVVETGISLDEARRRFRVNDDARRYVTTPEFSRRIRMNATTGKR